MNEYDKSIVTFDDIDKAFKKMRDTLKTHKTNHSLLLTKKVYKRLWRKQKKSLKDITVHIIGTNKKYLNGKKIKE